MGQMYGPYHRVNKPADRLPNRRGNNNDNNAGRRGAVDLSAVEPSQVASSRSTSTTTTTSSSSSDSIIVYEAPDPTGKSATAAQNVTHMPMPILDPDSPTAGRDRPRSQLTSTIRRNAATRRENALAFRREIRALRSDNIPRVPNVDLSFLRSNPYFQSFRDVTRVVPQMAGFILEHTATRNQRLAAVIRHHNEEIMRMSTEEDGETDGHGEGSKK